MWSSSETGFLLNLWAPCFSEMQSCTLCFWFHCLVHFIEFLAETMLNSWKPTTTTTVFKKYVLPNSVRSSTAFLVSIEMFSITAYKKSRQGIRLWPLKESALGKKFLLMFPVKYPVFEPYLFMIVSSNSKASDFRGRVGGMVPMIFH